MRRYEVLSQLWTPFLRKNISIYAAGACFYLFLSSIPGSILFLVLISKISFISELLSSFIQVVFPEALTPLLSSFWKYIEHAHSPSVVSLSLFTLVWTSSKGILAIMDGTNYVFDFPKTKNYFFRQFLSILYFLLLCFCILLVLISMVFYDYLISQLPQVFDKFKSLFRYRGFIAFVILTFTLMLLVRFLPSKHISFSNCLLAAIISSVGWMLLSLAFSFYVRYFTNYNRLFGGLGMIMLLQIWLKSCISLYLYSCRYIRLKQSVQYHPMQIIKRFLFFRN